MTGAPPFAGVRFFDRAADRTVLTPLTLRVQDGTWMCNTRGTWSLTTLQGHDDPSELTEGSVDLRTEVFDPSGNYLPRAFTLTVPRVVGGAPDLREVVAIELPPSPALAMRGTWAALRVSVHFPLLPGQSEPTPIEGALVRLESIEDGLRCMSLTNQLGEALVIGHGIPLASASDEEDAILEPAAPHRVIAVFDRAATSATTGRRTTLADPDDLWTRRASLATRSFDLSLGVGAQQTHAFELTPTP